MRSLMIIALALVWAMGIMAQEAATSTETTDKAIAVPSTIDFQGRLHDSGGSPVNATLNITFSLYTVASGGTVQWTETRSVQVVDGLFQVKLGEVTPFNASHFSGTDRWLGIKVGSEAEMSPRTKFSSVGYAMQAANGLDGSGSDSQTLRHDGSNWVASSFLTNSGSNIGIGSFPTLNHKVYVFRPEGDTGPGKSNLYAQRIGVMSATGGGTSWAFTDVDAAIKGYSYVGNPFTAGIAGYSDHDYQNSAAIIGSRSDAVLWGALAFNDANSKFWGGYFTGDLYASGNVGIGVTAPTQTLDVNGQIRIRGGSPAAGRVLTSDADGTASWAQAGLSLPFSATTNSGGYAFQIVNTVSDSYYNFGLCGIGASGIIGMSDHFGQPGNGFGVIGTAGDAGVGVHGAGGTGVMGTTNAGSGAGVSGEALNSTAYSGYFTGGKFYVNSQVGLNTTAPTQTLDINGTVRLRNHLFDYNNTSGTTGQVLTRGASGVLWQNLPASQWASSGSNIYYNNGNVGIGTNSPTNKLDIYNGTNNTYARIKSGFSSAILILDRYDWASEATIYFNNGATFQFSTGLAPNGTNNYRISAGGYDLNGLEVEKSTGNVNLSSNLNVSGNLLLSSTSKAGIATTPRQQLSVGNYLDLYSGYVNAPTRPSIRASTNNNLIINAYDTGILYFNFDGGTGETRFYSGTTELFHIGANGNVGIREGNPQAGLHLKGTGFPASFMYLEANAGQDAGFRLYEGTTAKWHIFNNAALAGLQIYNSANATAIFAKQSNSYVGIGNTAPTQMLDVNGNGRFRAIGSGAYAGVVNRTSDGTLTTATSDIRLKENIQTLEGGLDKVLQLRGVSFTWKQNPEYGTRIGFIAQEFEQVIPELVFTNEVDGFKGINYAEVSAVLVEAVKEQQAEIDRLKAENEHLRQNDSQLNARLERLEQALQSLVEK